VSVVLGPVIGQVAAQFARQRWPVIRTHDAVVDALTTAAITVVRTMICAHGRSEKSPAATGNLTRQARVRTMLVARVPPQFRLAGGAICVARFAHFAYVVRGRLSVAIGPRRHKMIGHRHWTCVQHVHLRP